MSKTILHEVLARSVTYSPDGYAAINVPKNFWEPAGIAKNTHLAFVLCRQDDQGEIVCDISLHKRPKKYRHTRKKHDAFHTLTMTVNVSRTNAMIKLPSVIVSALDIEWGTHSIDWYCTVDRDVTGLIYKI